MAWRNNTFSLHVHVGVNGAERAVRVCDRLRAVMPELLAISANSPFLDGRHSGLHSARTQIFTKSFPRCGIPDAFGAWQAYADYIDFLVRTNSIIEFTQVWWSVRPHHSYGTVEMRICDAQTSADDSTALAALITSCIAQAALDHDEGVPFDDPPRRMIEENLWRAIRHGLDGKLIDLERAGGVPGGGRARPACWPGPRRRGVCSASIPAYLTRTAPAPEARARRRGDYGRHLCRRGGAHPAHLRGRGGSDVNEPQQPTEEQLLDALRQIKTEDVVLQTVATLVNLAGQKLSVEGAKDPAEAQKAIDAREADAAARAAGRGRPDPERARPGSDAVRQGEPGAPAPAEEEPPKPKIWTPGS